MQEYKELDGIVWFTLGLLVGILITSMVVTAFSSQDTSEKPEQPSKNLNAEIPSEDKLRTVLHNARNHTIVEDFCHEQGFDHGYATSKVADFRLIISCYTETDRGMNRAEYKMFDSFADHLTEEDYVSADNVARMD